MVRLWAVLAIVLMAAGAQALEAGAAKIEITPPLGTPLNGYFDRLGRGAVAVHDDLWVRCLYLSDGETQLLLVNADLCFIHPELRAKVVAAGAGLVHGTNVMGYIAALAAYRDGREWLNQLMAYLEANRDYLFDFVQTRLPGIITIKPEGTSNRLSVRAFFYTHSILGKLYWHSLLPIHFFLFQDLIEHIEKRS